jgi:hypothetical protein
VASPSSPVSPLVYARAPRQLVSTIHERAGSDVDGLLMRMAAFGEVAASSQDNEWVGALAVRGAQHGGVAGHLAEFDAIAFSESGARLAAHCDLAEFCTAFATTVLDVIAGPIARVERAMAHAGLASTTSAARLGQRRVRALAMRVRATVTLRRVDPRDDRDARGSAPCDAATLDGTVVCAAFLCSRGGEVPLYPRPRGAVRVVERPLGGPTDVDFAARRTFATAFTATAALLSPVEQFVRESSGVAPRPASLRWNPDSFPRSEDERAWRPGTLVVAPPAIPRRATPAPALHPTWVAECVIEAVGAFDETKDERFALAALVAEHVWGDAAFAREARELFAHSRGHGVGWESSRGGEERGRSSPRSSPRSSSPRSRRQSALF